MMLNRVIVRLKQPSSVKNPPSESLNSALTSLADADELKTLVCEATTAGCALALDVYRNRQGYPFLINIKQEDL